MVHCANCNNECEWLPIMVDQDTPLLLWDWNTALYCETCLNNKIVSQEVTYYKWVYYHNRHPSVTSCNACWAPIHVNAYSASWGYCNRCIARRYIWERHYYNWYNNGTERNVVYCTNCWAFHIDWLCNWCLDDARISKENYLRFTVRKDHKSRDPKGCASTDSVSDRYIKTIWQFQTERDLDAETMSMLKDFYHHTRDFKHYYTREPIHIEWTVVYQNTKILSDISHTLESIRMRRERSIKEWKKVSKYSNYYLKGLTDDWLVKRGYIDIMWNIRERCESINKFFEDVGIDKTNAQMTWEFRYVLSSNIKHKIKAFKLNDKVSSCQKSHNYDSFARWAYDAITIWCNCPILLYNKWSDEPFARITTRIMYDKEGQEYILIDRIYHSWEFSDSLLKWTVYKWIVQDLKQKWYKVIASNYSAHDESTYSYLASLGMNSTQVVQDLCQPLRRIIWSYGYYCDGWTVVRSWTIDEMKRATDYLDKAYVL